MSIFRGNVNPLNIVTALTPASPLGTSASGIAPSGTINTGSSGNITLGSALNRAFTEGIWLYLPTIATTPAITAGMYWVVMSSTTGNNPANRKQLLILGLSLISVGIIAVIPLYFRPIPQGNSEVLRMVQS